MKNNFTPSETTSNEMFKYNLASASFSRMNHAKYGEEMNIEHRLCGRQK